MEIQKAEDLTYIIFTPTRNEEKYIEKTIQSVINQTVLPVYWFIVDDNSTDNTPNIIECYGRDYRFIQYSHVKYFRPDLKSTGGRSAALKNYLRQLIQELPSDIIVNIDSDIAFDPDFFERLFECLKKNKKLGIVSGHLLKNGKPERMRDFDTNRGAVRVYNRKCFDQIGRYYECRGEDQMDTYIAQYYGWETMTSPVYFHHLKPEGARHHRIHNHFETGNYKGRIPYYLPYFLLTLVKHLFRYPIIFGSMVQLYAYFIQRYITKDSPFPKEVCNFIISKQKHWVGHFSLLFKRI